jgi:hypothetical protein
MHKLSVKIMVVLCKSCRTFHKESNEIGFAFFWFFYDFLRIFKVSAKALYYLRFCFTGRSLELLFLLQIGPYFTNNTLERRKGTRCSPWAWRVAPLAGIGRLRRCPWSGKRWGGRGAHLLSVCGRRRGGKAAGEGGRRRLPLELLLRRGGGRGWNTSGTGRFGGT